MRSTPPASDEDWSGPGAAPRRARFTWNALLWSLVYPARGHRILPTIPGVVLIGLSLGIGTAAYNSSSNILFITLSLLLACLILSGVLSWLNLRGVTWRLELSPPLRVGHDTIVTLSVRNDKKFLPTYGLWFQFAARPQRPANGQRAESTLTAKGIDVRAALAQADKDETRGRAALQARLEPGGTTQLEWVLQPRKRGRLQVELVSVGSLFPFGFLRKDIGADLLAETVVWPAPVEYRRHAGATSRRPVGGERMARAGTGTDLLALRRYTLGDSHRLIHWKASARTGQLLVRQFAAEATEGYSLWLRTDAGMWARAEQFELLLGFAATIAEDLFRAGRLYTVAVDAHPPMPVRRGHDLESFLDEIALVQPSEGVLAGEARTATAEIEPALALMGGAMRRNVLTFVPDGAVGVAAYADGVKVAST